MKSKSMRHVRVMRGHLIIARVEVILGLQMMFCGKSMILGCELVMRVIGIQIVEGTGTLLFHDFLVGKGGGRF
jgi:uncharacterized membrane-anchored protein